MSYMAQAAEFFGRLATIPAAGRFLGLFPRRDVEFRVGGEAFTCEFDHGRVSVRPGAARAEEKLVLETDAETWQGLMAGRITYTDAGGGYIGRLHCTDGLCFFPDLSWLGNLVRLAQEHR